MGKAELKPCPFCGKNAHVYATSYPNGEKRFASAACTILVAILKIPSEQILKQRLTQ